MITLDEQIKYIKNRIWWTQFIMPKERDTCEAILQSLESLREEEDERD